MQGLRGTRAPQPDALGADPVGVELRLDLRDRRATIGHEVVVDLGGGEGHNLARGQRRLQPAGFDGGHDQPGTGDPRRLDPEVHRRPIRVPRVEADEDRAAHWFHLSAATLP